MGKIIKKVLAIALLIMLTSQGQVSALSIADNRELYTDSLTKEDIKEIHDMDYLIVSLRYQSKDGGEFVCDRKNPPECNFVEGDTHDHYTRVRGKARVFELNNGKKILDVRAKSSEPGLGLITIQQEYEDSLISKEKRAKIVTSGYDFPYGTNLNSNDMRFRQRSNYNFQDETASIASLRSYLSTPKRSLGLAHWRDVGNLRVSIMTYHRFKPSY